MDSPFNEYTSSSVCFSHYVTHEPQPLLENVVHVGGIHIKVGTIFILICRVHNYIQYYLHASAIHPVGPDVGKHVGKVLAIFTKEGFF